MRESRITRQPFLTLFLIYFDEIGRLPRLNDVFSDVPLCHISSIIETSISCFLASSLMLSHIVCAIEARLVRSKNKRYISLQLPKGVKLLYLINHMSSHSAVASGQGWSMRLSGTQLASRSRIRSAYD